MYRQRFGLISHVFPQDACGQTFIETPSFHKLQRRFKMLARDPGLGVLTSRSGEGKTTSVRHLASSLPRPDYQVVYTCDTATSPLDFYRQLALEFGITPSHRRAQLWHDLKTAMLKLVDEQSTRPVVLVDEAQHLSDRFLLDLSGFLNFAMDSRNVFVMWLIGQPWLRTRLKMRQHSALASRVAASVCLEPLNDRNDFMAFLDAGLKAAGATSSLLADTARELLFRASRGIPRQVARLLREALMLAHEQDKNFVDDVVMEAVLDEEDF